MPKELVFKKIISFAFARLAALFKINDSAQKIALGVGLGVFSGLMPGTGPVAALFLAFVFRANRAAALLGSIFTNTWLSLATFILAIKLGSVILKLRWAKFFKLSFLGALFPVIIGYIIIGLFLGIISYLITLFILRRNFHGRKTIYP